MNIIGFCHDCKWIQVDGVCDNVPSPMHGINVNQNNSRCSLQEEAQPTAQAIIDQLSKTETIKIGDFSYTPALVGDVLNGWIKRHKSYYPVNQWNAIKSL